MDDLTLTIEDAASRLADLISEITAQRRSAVITQDGKPIARITPIWESNNAELVAILRRWRELYPEPDEDFCRAIEETRKGVRPLVDLWEE